MSLMFLLVSRNRSQSWFLGLCLASQRAGWNFLCLFSRLDSHPLLGCCCQSHWETIPTFLKRFWNLCLFVCLFLFLETWQIMFFFDGSVKASLSRKTVQMSTQKEPLRSPGWAACWGPHCCPLHRGWAMPAVLRKVLSTAAEAIGFMRAQSRLQLFREILPRKKKKGQNGRKPHSVPPFHGTDLQIFDGTSAAGAWGNLFRPLQDSSCSC